MMSKYILVVPEEAYKVIEDYITSINIITKIIYLKNFNINKYLVSNDFYIFCQIWIDLKTFPKNVFSSPRFIYINFEMLTEQNRMDNVVQLIKNNIKVIDYSTANINFLIDYLYSYKINFNINNIIYIPYQFNLLENELLKNINNEYEYDIGIINALPKQDSSVNSELTYRRTELWNNIQDLNYTSINILGWGKERDILIKKCKIIINIHHFEVFNIFEHIRCDRLIFANKIIVSDNSLYMDKLDIYDNIYWENFDDILITSIKILDNFDYYNNIILNKSSINIIENRKILLNNSLKKINIKPYDCRGNIINEFINIEHKYLEIGIENGITFNMVKCNNKTGIDPDPIYKSNLIIEKTSDDFFKTNKNSYDIIFIDGMHQIEYVLRDFNNSMNCLTTNGIIFLDDIFPISEREQLKIPINHVYENNILKYREAWTGDVWKFVYYLILNYKNNIEYQLFIHDNYRGVIMLKCNKKIQINEENIYIINNYNYNIDFINYIKLLCVI
jgi:hypothetical protein